MSACLSLALCFGAQGQVCLLLAHTHLLHRFFLSRTSHAQLGAANMLRLLRSKIVLQRPRHQLCARGRALVRGARSDEVGAQMAALIEAAKQWHDGGASGRQVVAGRVGIRGRQHVTAARTTRTAIPLSVALSRARAKRGVASTAASRMRTRPIPLPLVVLLIIWVAAARISSIPIPLSLAIAVGSARRSSMSR